jgi:hypothetical protein
VKHVYHDFRRNHPKTAIELHDMMQRWADQEDEEKKCFPKSNNDKHNNDNHSDKGQWNYWGSSRKRKPDDLVTAIERKRHGKKLRN